MALIYRLVLAHCYTATAAAPTTLVLALPDLPRGWAFAGVAGGALGTVQGPALGMQSVSRNFTQRFWLWSCGEGEEPNHLIETDCGAFTIADPNTLLQV